MPRTRRHIPLNVFLNSRLVGRLNRQASGAIDFVSANSSIGFAGDSQACADDPSPGALHLAACNLVEQGVVLSMSAGTSAALPGASPPTVVVSALAAFHRPARHNGRATRRRAPDAPVAGFPTPRPTRAGGSSSPRHGANARSARDRRRYCRRG